MKLTKCLWWIAVIASPLIMTVNSNATQKSSPADIRGVYSAGTGLLEITGNYMLVPWEVGPDGCFSQVVDPKRLNGGLNGIQLNRATDVYKAEIAGIELAWLPDTQNGGMTLQVAGFDAGHAFRTVAFEITTDRVDVEPWEKICSQTAQK